MATRVRTITVDCRDPEALGRFWAAVTGRGDDPDNPNEPGDPEWFLPDPDGGPTLLFVRVPEPKTAKNRLHLDLVPDGPTRDEEVARVLGLGAEQAADHRRPDGTGWVVLRDPEGNEFCVERSAVERSR